MVSIVTPVYKAEKTLERCVRSALAQEYTDWELILVDDGSPDESGRLCDQWAATDERIRVVHQVNKGVSEARNRGVEEARGDYLLFVDADDWMEPGMCAALLGALEGTEADTAGCAHWNVQPDGAKTREAGALPAGVYGPGELRREVAGRLLGQRLGRPGEVLNGFIWRFLFSRKVIVDNHLRFEGAYLEDELFLLEYACLAKGLVMVDEPYYNYLQNPASVTRNYLPNYMNTFRRFMEAKRALAAKYGLGADDPQWEANSNWAGLLIAVGNEYAASNPRSWREKEQQVKAFTKEPEMAKAMETLRPQNMGRNKQLVAELLRRRWFGLLTLLYRVKNRG